MSAPAPLAHHAVRKSAFGRTSLFLTEGGVAVRNVNASASGVQRIPGTVYHNLAETAKRVDGLCCWHCCEVIGDGPSYRIPKYHDLNEDQYHVFGHFCSLSCGKAYILEDDRYDRGYALNIFHRMARAVYGVHDRIIETPPRIALQKFGGPFPVPSVAQACRPTAVVEPPFVSYCMLVEEREQSSVASGERFGLGTQDGNAPPALPPCRLDPRCPTRVDDDFTEPPARSMYDDYVQQQQQQRVEGASGASDPGGGPSELRIASIAAAPAPAARKRSATRTGNGPASSDAGTLRRFQRRTTPAVGSATGGQGPGDGTGASSVS